MAIAGLIVNIFLPGIGTLMCGKIAQGIIQVCLGVLSLILNLTVFLAIIGIPLYAGVWIWAIVSAATAIERDMKRN
jgi:TM2 domain-containing membrane protein YozV